MVTQAVTFNTYLSHMLTINKAGYSGILIPELNIGLDYSGTRADFVFISHAHTDHMPRKKGMNIFATAPTAKLMKLRGFNDPVTVVPYGQPFETSEFKVTFFPAGHILGSALTFIESKKGNVLYTGDYRTPPSPATEGFELPKGQIDHFITEATFALPIYKWASHDELKKQVLVFAEDALSEGYTPIFQAYNLGKAQELMYWLKELDHPMQIHGAGYKLCGVYEEFGFDLGNYESYNRSTCEGNILIAPGSAIGNGFASNLKKTRFAYCSGWAAHESRRTQLTADSLIPLSDHLDFFELIDVCKKLKPGLVHVTHTPNPDVVQHFLQAEGIKSTFLDLEVETND